MATATKALAALREAGLVEAVPGVGTVVRESRRLVDGPKRPADSAVTSLRGRQGNEPELSRERVVRTAVEVADADGLDAVSMRRVAHELGTGAMTLYRYVGSKEELFQSMADAVFGENEFSEPGPAHWRDRLEQVARLQWRTYRRHPWVAVLVASVSVPPLMPSGMAQVEWQLRGLEGLGLDHLSRLRIVISLASYVAGVALGRELETEALQGGNPAGRDWRAINDDTTEEVLHSGRFPMLAALDVDDEDVLDVDALFEFGLQRHLDGIGALIARSTPLSPHHHPQL